MNIKKALIFICIICLFVMSFISQNEYHLDNCLDEDCQICIMIQIAKAIMNNLMGVIVLVIESFIIYFLLSRIKKIETIITNKSLIFRKVQLNE